MTRAALAIPAALLCASCAHLGASLQGIDTSAPDSGSSRVFLVDRSMDALAFEIERVVIRLGMPLDQVTVDGVHASIRTGSFAASPNDFHCGAHPSGEEPVARTVTARLSIALEPTTARQTRARFDLSSEGAAAEPTLRAREERCVSRGTLERRIIDLASRRT